MIVSERKIGETIREGLNFSLQNLPSPPLLLVRLYRQWSAIVSGVLRTNREEGRSESNLTLTDSHQWRVVEGR